MRRQSRPTHSARFTLAFAIVLAMLAALPVRSQQEPASPAGNVRKASTIERDLEAFQGRWERSLAGDDDQREGAAKATKEIAGNRESVTYVNDAGEPVYATAADFALTLVGRVKLYTYENLKVTKGKSKGGDPPTGAVSYIYRVDGDQYHEAHGLLVDSPPGSKPVVVTWKRVK
jgi:hypothetical protein